MKSVSFIVHQSTRFITQSPHLQLRSVIKCILGIIQNIQEIIIINLITYIKQHFQPVIRIYHFTILKYKKCCYYYLRYIVKGTWLYLSATFPLTSVCVWVCVCVCTRARTCICKHTHTGYEISAHRKLKCAQKIKFQKI